MRDLKSHAIYLALRRRSLSNDIEPGTRLVMRDVANQYRASDIPVREACACSGAGLVEPLRPRGDSHHAHGQGGRGDLLHPFAPGEHHDGAGSRAHHGLRAFPARPAHDRYAVAVDSQDGPTFSDLDPSFAARSWPAADDMLRELTMDIWQRHSGFQRVFRMVPGRLATSQSEHEGIMAALRDHDAERASRLALLHKQSVRDSVSTLVGREGKRESDQVGDGTRPVGTGSRAGSALGRRQAARDQRVVAAARGRRALLSAGGAPRTSGSGRRVVRSARRRAARAP